MRTMAYRFAVIAVAAGAMCAQALDLTFQAEDVVVNRDAWQKDSYSETRWNLWSTDRDADKKWSGGVVLQSPRVLEDRAAPDEGAPVLHVRVTGIPKGTFELALPKVGRVLGVSLDGTKWERFRGGVLIPELSSETGTVEFWVDDRYALEDKERRGSAYLDTVVLSSLEPLNLPERPPVNGWARRRVGEPMGRGLVALRTDEGVYLSWRLLREDPAEVAFDVFRRNADGGETKLSPSPVRRTTDYLDSTSPAGDLPAYIVRPVGGGREGTATTVEKSGEAAYVTVKLEDATTTFQKAGIADLNGDGVYDVVIKQPNANIDPAGSYWKRSPDTYKLEAYLADGTFLWSHDLGWAIERGIWYSPYIVHDLTGDGKAEVAAKIGEGDPRGEDGRVTSGPEWVVVWDGMTGREIDRAPWPKREHFREYSRASRNQIATAYLDGKTPCLLTLRGTYDRMLVDAYQLRQGKLEALWSYDNETYGRRYRGQGAHFTLAADVDRDGRDEVILGSAVVDDNGLPLWTTAKGHPDAAYLTDADPRRPGLEMAYVMETRQRRGGLCLADAATGKLLWELDEPTQHVHGKGLCADIDPTVPGQEIFGMDSVQHKKTDKRWLFGADGTLLRSGPKELTFGFSVTTAYWDADLQKEIVSGSITDYQGGRLARVEGRVQLIADVLGDWREELIASVPGEMRIYCSTIPANDRRVCLMQDPVYRAGVRMNAMGYTQTATLPSCLEAAAPNLNLTALQATGGRPTCRLVVSAPLDRAVQGTVVLASPQALVADPGRVEVDLAPGERLVREVGVTATDSAVRSGVIEARLDLPEGPLRARVTLRVTSPFLQTGIVVQAEALAAEEGGNVQLRTDKPGTMGEAISHWDDQGHALEWGVAIPRTGTYRLVVRYSTPARVRRRVSLDGADAGLLELPSTGGFGDAAVDWDHGVLATDGRPVVLRLEEGRRRLRLTNADGRGCNLDYLALVPCD